MLNIVGNVAGGGGGGGFIYRAPIEITKIRICPKTFVRHCSLIVWARVVLKRPLFHGLVFREPSSGSEDDFCIVS